MCCGRYVEMCVEMCVEICKGISRRISWRISWRISRGLSRGISRKIYREVCSGLKIIVNFAGRPDWKRKRPHGGIFNQLML